jgi:outer membrane protein
MNGRLNSSKNLSLALATLGVIGLGASTSHDIFAQQKKKNDKEAIVEKSKLVKKNSSQNTYGTNSTYPSKETDPRFVDGKNPNAKDLLTLYRDAATNDPNFNAARGAYAAGKESFWQGLSALLPQVTGSANSTKNDLRFAERSGTNRSVDTLGWRVDLNQPLINWSKFESYRVGNFQTGIAEANFAQAQQDLVIRVTQAYFDALTAQNNLDLFRNKKSLIKEQLDQAKRNFEIGTSTIVDSNEAQSRYDIVLAQELGAQADLVIKKSALELIVGQPVDAILPVSEQAKIELVADKRKVKYRKGDKGELATQEIIQSMNLPTGQSMEDWVKQAEDVNYAVLASKLAVDLAQSNLNAARAGHAPSLNLVGATSYTDVTAAITGSATGAPSKLYNNQIGLQLSVPIFAGGYTQATVRQNAGLLEQAKANYELAKRSNSLAAKQAYLGFNNGLAQVKAYEAAEKSALSSLQSNRLGYDVGVRINIDVLNAQDQLFTTRAQLYKARYDAIVNGLKLKSIAAVLTDEDLQAVNGLLK